MSLPIMNRFYFIAAALLLLVEIVIAVFIRDNFVRPYLGDVLVVILLYCTALTFVTGPKITVALCVLGFSFMIEFLQYFGLVEKLGMQKSTVAKIILGSTFAWHDLLAYAVGIAFVLWFERLFRGTATGVQAAPCDTTPAPPRASADRARLPEETTYHKI